LIADISLSAHQIGYRQYIRKILKQAYNGYTKNISQFTFSPARVNSAKRLGQAGNEDCLSDMARANSFPGNTMQSNQHLEPNRAMLAGVFG
jgi:2-iminoacetate synthase ThiH